MVIDYLLSQPVQEKALSYGFRPSLPEIALGAPFDIAHGVDAKEPSNSNSTACKLISGPSARRQSRKLSIISSQVGKDPKAHASCRTPMPGNARPIDKSDIHGYID